MMPISARRRRHSGCLAHSANSFVVIDNLAPIRARIDPAHATRISSISSERSGIRIGVGTLHCRAAFSTSNRCIFRIIAFLFFIITLPGTFLMAMIFAFWQVNDPPGLLQSGSGSISPSGFTT
jgi:hypothetical protein